MERMPPEKDQTLRNKVWANLNVNVIDSSESSFLHDALPLPTKVSHIYKYNMFPALFDLVVNM